MATSKKPLKATPFFKPYDGKKCTLKGTGSGVYIIRKNGVIYYVGMSKNDVKQTMYRHFQLWNDYRNDWVKKVTGQNFDRVTYYNEDRSLFSCKVIFTPTAREAAILEQHFILKFKPKDNTLKLLAFSDTEYMNMANKIDNLETIKASEEPDWF